MTPKPRCSSSPWGRRFKNAGEQSLAVGQLGLAKLERRTILGTLKLMTRIPPILTVAFFRTEADNEPVREWLTGLGREQRRLIGIDIKTVQLGWPIGMPVVRKLEPKLWEVRSDLEGIIARVIFTVVGSQMILLHGFIKKSQKTPTVDLQTARQRHAKLRGTAHE